MKNVLAISIMTILLGSFAHADENEIECSKEQISEMIKINNNLVRHGLFLYQMTSNHARVAEAPKVWSKQETIDRISRFREKVASKEYPDCANRTESESFESLDAVLGELDRIQSDARIELLLNKRKIDLQVDAYREKLEKELQGNGTNVQLEQKTNPKVDSQNNKSASEGRS
ncbi:MAG: hypothetical protein KDD37_08045 [Bdellovibrionales bacterium]|nr:hypothetical protein [Bdellovibrionales bacterium]